MNDELHNRLMRAADDADRPLPVQPTELLAHARRDRKRHRVQVAGASGALAIGAVAAVIGAVAVVPSGDDGSDSGVAPAGSAHGSKVEPTVEPTAEPSDFDRGPMSADQIRPILLNCAGTAIDAYDVVLARRYADLWGERGMIVARSPEGQLIDCSANIEDGVSESDGADFGTLAKDVAHMPVPGAVHPIVAFKPFYDHGFASSDEVPGDFWLSWGFFRVADTVDRVEFRLGTPGGPEQWTVSKPHDGLVFWSAWVRPGEYEGVDELRIEWRAYDTNGDLIDPDLMPYEPQWVDITL
ncbi:MAG TPA: hypothetical protein VEX15_04870 [Nocardioidaceae bacterium]|nr:hypothetical protein [Nocardioidaceae bacterium]